MNLNLEDLINQAHEAAALNNEPRDYLGCSIAGHSCERRLWLTYRWAIREKLSGRTLRMFRRGHAEERAVIADLQAIGCRIRHRQRQVFLGHDIRGHIDGIVTGVPGHEKERFLLEIKTLNRDRFRAVETKGVEIALHDHWVQVQLYLLGIKLNRALYFAVCKDDDRIYTEIVQSNLEFATRTVERLSRLITDPRIPAPISTNPTWWECKGCPAHGFCHQKIPVTAHNCRTCEHASREADGGWLCHVNGPISIPSKPSLVRQRMGCDRHELHSDLQ